MNKILVLGAGRSSSSLINYLKKNSSEYGWQITIGDASIELATLKVANHSNAAAVKFDVNNESLREELVKNHDLVISLMPPSLHFLVAQTCLKYSKNLLTASYVSPEMAELDKDAKQKNVLLLMECGLDPGIDHMSAMKEIVDIKNDGGVLTGFKSFTGGLVATESDDNPWHYKITWNPRNVVMAGKGISTYLENCKVKEVGYNELFNTIEKFYVEGYGEFEGYPNRDSLKYLETYRLEKLNTFLRGTLRRPGYSSAWNILVNLGYTDDQISIEDNSLTYRQLTDRLLKSKGVDSIEALGKKEDIDRIIWLGLTENRIVGLDKFSPADALQKMMEEKWKLNAGDKDMIVMQHQFEYSLNGKKYQLVSSLVVEGEDEHETAMAKTVGLPLGIAAKLILTNQLHLSGVQVPVKESIYLPVLKELAALGIDFKNEVIELG